MKKTALFIAVSGLALGSAIALTAQSDTDSSTASSSWSDRWQKLENQLDQVFHDSVSKLSPGANDQDLAFSSSVDLREKPDAYVARVYLPKGDEAKMTITFGNGTLHIASDDKATGAFDQNISIPGPVQADKMKVEHKGGIVVIILPKAAGSIAVAPSSPANEPLTQGWDQQVVREMQRMQDRMDQMTNDMFSGSSNTPAVTQQPSLYGSSVNLENEKDKYVVHFYLPDRDLSNVKAEVKNDELQITATQESKKETTNKSGSTSEYSSGESSQVITLPGPVHADQMKIDRKDGTVTVTLPKA